MTPAPPRSALAGIFPVLCTPFDARGAIDLASLDRLVDFALDSGADGLTVGGVASEVHKLADEERRALAEGVLARVAARGASDPRGRAPVWVGAGHQSTEASIEHALHAQRHGAAGAMVMPPWVARPSLAQLSAFFRDLDRAVELPVMIQDAPLVSGLHLPVEWLLDVATECRRTRAVKVEAPPTGPKIAELAQRGGGSLALFGGLGGSNLVCELERGAAGSLPGCAFPELHVEILARFRAGRAAEAAALHRRATPLIRFVSQSVEWSYHAYKRLLVERGVIETAYVRRPTVRFDERDQAELMALWKDVEPALEAVRAAT